MAVTEDRYPTDAETWTHALKASQKHLRHFEKRADAVIERYRDETAKGAARSDPKMNILWSNTETKRPALYSQMPKPQVACRFYGEKPENKVLNRKAADVLEKTIAFSIDNGLDDFDLFANMIVGDFLLPGRSVDRVIYEPLNSGEEVVFEQVRYHHCPWSQFLHDPQDRWEDVDWIAYGDHFFSEDELKEEFDLTEKDLEGINFSKQDGSEVQTAQVWEIWDKKGGEVIWHVLDSKATLKTEGPPVNLRGFFDCPRPLFAVKSNDTLVPIPEYCLYQYQAEEVNSLTKRIDKLTRLIKANFAYAGDSKNVLTELLTSDDGKGIAVQDWTAMLERSGVDGLISWAPIEQFAKVLQILTLQRAQLIQQIFELTGIADILRGSTDPRETAKAQVIKANFGSRRLLPQQQDVQRYFRDLFRLAGEIIVENFSRSTIEDILGQSVEDQVLQVLRSDADRAFRVDIETDSTIQPDANEQKQEMAEFVSSLAQFSDVAMRIAATGPAGQAAAGVLIGWFCDTFRAPRQVKEAIEAAANQPPQPPPPDPKLLAIQAKTQADQQKAGLDAQVAQKKLEMEMQEKQVELQMKMVEAQTDLQLAQKESEAKIMNMMAETEAKIAAMKAQAAAKVYSEINNPERTQ